MMSSLPIPPWRGLLLAALLVLSGCWHQGPEQRWELASQGAYSGALSSTAAHLVIGSIHQGGSFWSTQPPAREYDWNHRSGGFSEILHTAYSPDNGLVLTADYHNLVLWDAETGEALQYWTAPARIEAVDLSADGRFALLGLSNNRAVLFDALNGGILRQFAHDGPVLSVSLSADADLALTGSQDLSARLWDVDQDELIQRFDLPNQVTLVTLSDAGDRALLAPAREDAAVWDLAARRKLADLPTGKHRLFSARFVAGDRLLVGTTHRDVLQFNVRSGERQGHWRIGSFWQNAFRSATVLDMAWRNDRLWALGSDGYLYGF